MKKVLSTLFLMIFFTGSVYAADALYVQSMRAKLKKKPSFRSETVAYVERGDRLEVIGTVKGSWRKVSTGKQVGWIHRLSVSKNKPMKKVKYLAGTRSYDIGSKARRRASAITSAAAARGYEGTIEGIHANFESLSNLELFAQDITDEEVEQFMFAEETE